MGGHACLNMCMQVINGGILTGTLNFQDGAVPRRWRLLRKGGPPQLGLSPRAAHIYQSTVLLVLSENRGYQQPRISRPLGRGIRVPHLSVADERAEGDLVRAPFLSSLHRAGETGALPQVPRARVQHDNR